MKKTLLLSALALGLMTSLASAEPVKLTSGQMDSVVAGKFGPNLAPNGTNEKSGGKSGAPGNSFHPGQ
jgi:hypothetical protein